MHTVHVTSYLNFSAEIRGFPSRNSVNLRKIFRRASAPAKWPRERTNCGTLSSEYGCLA